MAVTGKNTVTLWRGENKTLRITLCNPPAGGIASWDDDMEMLLFESVTATDPILTKTDGFTITNNNGVIEILLEDSDTEDLTPAVYYRKTRRISNKVVFEFGPLIVLP